MILCVVFNKLNCASTALSWKSGAGVTARPFDCQSESDREMLIFQKLSIQQCSGERSEYDRQYQPVLSS